jgi:hypothetical protein
LAGVYVKDPVLASSFTPPSDGCDATR